MFKKMKLGVKLVTVGTLIMALPLGIVGYFSVTRATGAVQGVQNEMMASRSAELARFAGANGLGGAYQGVVVAGTGGRTFAASADSFVGMDISDRDYFRNALAGEATIGRPARNKVTGEPFVSVAAPVRDARGPVAEGPVAEGVAFVQAIAEGDLTGNLDIERS
jgi:C4-dicarboxylate-specific signal transduction histidine kinase